jgi:hypothetical protein
MSDTLRRDLGKQESRRLDADRLARGEITRDMLRQENDFFRSVDFSGWRVVEIGGEPVPSTPEMLAVVEALAKITDYSLPRSELATLVMNARAALAAARATEVREMTDTTLDERLKRAGALVKRIEMKGGAKPIASVAALSEVEQAIYDARAALSTSYRQGLEDAAKVARNFPKSTGYVGPDANERIADAIEALEAKGLCETKPGLTRSALKDNPK